MSTDFTQWHDVYLSTLNTYKIISNIFDVILPICGASLSVVALEANAIWARDKALCFAVSEKIQGHRIVCLTTVIVAHEPCAICSEEDHLYFSFVNLDNFSGPVGVAFDFGKDEIADGERRHDCEYV